MVHFTAIVRTHGSVLWCFGWAAGGHPACKKLSGEMLAWLCVWVNMQICIWPSWCHCHSLSLAPANPDWFYLPGAGSPGWSRTKSKRAVKWLHVCACVWVRTLTVNPILEVIDQRLKQQRSRCHFRNIHQVVAPSMCPRQTAISKVGAHRFTTWYVVLWICQQVVCTDYAIWQQLGRELRKGNRAGMYLTTFLIHDIWIVLCHHYTHTHSQSAL